MYTLEWFTYEYKSNFLKNIYDLNKLILLLQY